MKKRYNTPEDWEAARSKLIGLGEGSMRKSYYPELQDRLAELESTVAQLEETQKKLRKKVDEFEKFQKLAVGRELRIIELKNEITKLKIDISKCKDKAA